MRNRENDLYLRRNIDSNGKAGESWCWTNPAGGRISRFYGTRAEAMTYKPAFPRR